MTKFNRFLKILIVDDEKVICDFLSRFLRREGHSADIAINGTQALEMIQHNNYDLIFCDVNMPNMNGIEFFSHIQSHRPELVKHLIFTTGDVMEMNVQFLHQKTGCAYLQKPLGLELLRQTIQNYY